MSRVFKCDRCGSVFDQRGAERPRFIPPRTQNPADLCPDCTQSLAFWFARLTAEVVRCGECKHLTPQGKCAIFADDVVRPSASDFCSYGERKEEVIE